MEDLNALQMLIEALRTKRVTAEQVVLLVMNRAIASGELCHEEFVYRIDNDVSAVAVAPDGVVWMVGQMYTQIIPRSEYATVTSMFEVVSVFPVPIFKKRRGRRWDVVVAAKSGVRTIENVAAVRTIGDPRYFVTRTKGVDTLWSLWHDEVREEFAAPRVHRVHNHVLVECEAQRKRWLQQVGDASCRFAVRGKLLSAAKALTGMVAAIFETKQGRVLVRGEEGVLSPENAVEHRATEIGEQLYAATSTVACLATVHGISQMLVLTDSEARVCGFEVEDLSCYPLYATAVNDGSCRAMVIGGQANFGRHIQKDMRERQVLRRLENGQYVLAATGWPSFLAWGEQLEHSATVHRSGRVRREHFLPLAYAGFHKLLCEQELDTGGRILTDGAVQYGNPFDELLRLQSHGEGQFVAWVRRGEWIYRYSGTAIAHTP